MLCVASTLSLTLSPLAEQVPLWLLVYGLATALLGLSVLRLLRAPVDERATALVPVLVWAALIRLPLLATEPSLSDDINRYVWEGRVVVEGLDPYDLAPDAAALTELAGRSPEWSEVNHPYLPALYPAGAQWAFAGLASVWPDERLFRGAFVLCDLAVIGLLGLLLARRCCRMEGLLLYAWHPLVAVEGASSGHFEALAMLPLVGGLLLWERRRSSAAFLVWGAAISLKFVGGLPALFALGRLARSGDWRRLVTGGALVALPLLLLSLPFALDGSLPLGSLGEYGQHWTHHASVHALLSVFLETDAARGLVMLLGALVLAVLLWRGPPPLEGFSMLFLAMLVLSPVVHPWYGLWLLVLLPFRPRADLFVLVSLLPLSYLAWTAQAAGGTWQAPPWAAWLGYGLPLAIFLVLLGRSRGGAQSR